VPAPKRSPATSASLPDHPQRVDSRSRRWHKRALRVRSHFVPQQPRAAGSRAPAPGNPSPRAKTNRARTRPQGRRQHIAAPPRRQPAPPHAARTYASSLPPPRQTRWRRRPGRFRGTRMRLVHAAIYIRATRILSRVLQVDFSGLSQRADGFLFARSGAPVAIRLVALPHLERDPDHETPRPITSTP
jgi:hypothetical protein